MERYCRWMILNTSGQPSEEETADRMKQVEMSVKVD